MSQGGVYFSYLLRLWQVPVNGRLAWRILLENIQSGEKCGFHNLDELTAYLKLLTIDAVKKPGEGSVTEVQD